MNWFHLKIRSTAVGALSALDQDWRNHFCQPSRTRNNRFKRLIPCPLHLPVHPFNYLDSCSTGGRSTGRVHSGPNRSKSNEPSVAIHFRRCGRRTTMDPLPLFRPETVPVRRDRSGWRQCRLTRNLGAPNWPWSVTAGYSLIDHSFLLYLL